MIKRLPLALFVILGLLSFSGISAVNSSQLQQAQFQLVSPQACPLTGCAGGQRLNFQANYPFLVEYTAGINTNVCIVASHSSLVQGDTATLSDRGLITGQIYTPDACQTNLLAGETLLAAASTTLGTGSQDGLSVALRLDALANLGGNLKLYVVQKDASGAWSRLDTASSNSIVVRSSQTDSVYVAENSDQCGMQSPCFVNSGDDLAGGLGTALKDANDAGQNTTIKILGSYSIKANEILLDQPHIIDGSGSAVLQTASSTCTSAMLRITNALTLRGMEINDGPCSIISRDLIRIAAGPAVIIENNTLTGGANAIVVETSTSGVWVRANQIKQNKGLAFLRTTSSGSGVAYLTANNIYENGAGIQVNCANAGTADHNYWGPSILPSQAVSNCTAADGKQLGAAAAPEGKGLAVRLVNVTSQPGSLLFGQLTLSHASGSDFLLYVVDHGQGSKNNVPFEAQGSGMATACSDFFDLFLAEGSSASSLTAAFRYDQVNSNCIPLIESDIYCGQTDPALYPLKWYDPKTGLTTGWEAVGKVTAAGKQVTCDLAGNKITMTLGGSTANGHPNLADDLNFTPFVIGLPYTYGAPLLGDTFNLAYQINKITITWQTLSENGVAGFYVLRSTSENGIYTRRSGLIPPVGDGLIGGIYSFVDDLLNFGQTYWYKLEVISTDGSTIATFGPKSLQTATQTPTITQTYTKTQTLTPSLTPTVTLTPTITRTPTRTPTRTNTPTRTLYPTITRYVYRSPTFNYRLTGTFQTATSLFRTQTTATSTPNYAQTMTQQPTSLPPLSETATPQLTPTQTATETPDYTPTVTLSGQEVLLEKSGRYSGIDVLTIALGLGALLIVVLLIGYAINQRH
jgi:hypothetical protein